MSDRTDTLGRRTRLSPSPTGKRVSPTERDLRWFAALAEHGPLPSSFLLAFGGDRHRSEKRARERLTDLFHEDNTPHAGTYLARPAQQFRTIDSRYNQLVYDLTPASTVALMEAGMANHRQRSGPWLHNHMVACVTASIELACLTLPNIRYIPQSTILSRANAELRWTTNIADPSTGATFTKDLLPDAVFGLEYLTDQGTRYRFFAVEADRATEPATSSNFQRKSFERHLLQYTAYLEGGGYRQHLNLTAPMLVLNVTTSRERVERLLSYTRKFFPDGNNYQLFTAWDAFGVVWTPPDPNPALLTADWRTATGTFRPGELQEAAG
ncbi:replication-relaxation family protein [Erythrobacter sp. AP23]|uniref:replication-relaxation family protein n=1 Tax=Erythrobacter sp. AP23 TaxID=499656 RepID=UPI000ABE58C3|nr:replication-relaxation family protein [Erythrobacter sp. AP23]